MSSARWINNNHFHYFMHTNGWHTNFSCQLIKQVCLDNFHLAEFKKRLSFWTSIIFKLLLYKTSTTKNVLMPWGFSFVLRRTMLHIWLLYVYWSIFDRKIKMKTNAMNMRSHIMICIKLKLLRKRFMSMLQIQNSQAVWIKFKCNDSS